MKLIRISAAKMASLRPRMQADPFNAERWRREWSTHCGSIHARDDGQLIAFASPDASNARRRRRFALLKEVAGRPDRISALFTTCQSFMAGFEARFTSA